MENQNPEEEARVEQMIDELMRKAKIASQEYMKLDQETVDNITKAMSMAGLEHHMELAKMAVEETGRGIYEDKITKNMFATEYVYHSIKHEKTVGIIKENDEDGYVEIAEPVGIIAGVTPVTNPTSTTMFKSIIAAKTRNVIVFGFHPSAQKCSVAAATILRDAAVKAGAPENCILWVEEPSILATKLLMNHPDVSLILATGGKSYQKLGSDGSVFDILKKHNYDICDLKPGLCPIICKEKTKDISGQRIKSIVTLKSNNDTIHKEQGEVLFKDNGLSGIVIFNISSLIARKNLQNVTISLDLLPEYETKTFTQCRYLNTTFL